MDRSASNSWLVILIILSLALVCCGAVGDETFPGSVTANSFTDGTATLTGGNLTLLSDDYLGWNEPGVGVVSFIDSASSNYNMRVSAGGNLSLSMNNLEWVLPTEEEVTWQIDGTKLKVDSGTGIDTLWGSGIDFLAPTITASTKFMVTQGHPDYVIGQPSATVTDLYIQPNSSSYSCYFDLFSNPGDGGEHSAIRIYGVGSPSSMTNFECLWMGYDWNDGEYRIYTTSGGSGQPRALRMFVDVTEPNQLYFDTDGDIGIRTNPGYPLTVVWKSGDSTSTSYFGSSNASNDQIAVTAESGSSTGLYGASTTGLGASFSINPATTNSLDNVIQLQRSSTGTVANNLGGAIDFQIENDNSQTESSGRLGCILTDVTDGAENSAFVWYTREQDDDGLAARMRLNHDGFLSLRTTSEPYPLYVPWISGDAAGATVSVGSNDSGNDQVALDACSYSNVGLWGTSASYYGLYAQSVSGVAAGLMINPTSRNSVDEVLQLRRWSSGGTGQNGIGLSINFHAENDNSQLESSGRIGCLLTDVTDGSETSALTLYTRSGATVAEQARLDDAGFLSLRTTTMSYPFFVPWLSGDSTTTAYFGSSNASNNQIAVHGISNSDYGIRGDSTSSYGLYGVSSSGHGIYGTSTTGMGGYFNINPAGTANLDDVIILRRNTSGTAANNIGGAITYYIEHSGGGVHTAAKIGALLTTAANGSEDSAIVWHISASGGATSEKMRLDHLGKLAVSGGIQTVRATNDVADPPTDAELDTAFGTPATVGAGFVGILDDNDAGTDVYICFTTGTDAEWFYVEGTKAL